MKYIFKWIVLFTTLKKILIFSFAICLISLTLSFYEKIKFELYTSALTVFLFVVYNVVYRIIIFKLNKELKNNNNHKK